MLNKVKDFLLKAHTGSGIEDLSEDLIAEFGESCKKALIKQLTRGEGEYRVRASGIGRPICQQQYEKMLAPKEDPEYNSIIRFLFGDILESIVIFLLKSSGVNVEMEQGEVKLHLNGVDIPGTCDLVVDGKMWDIKSASPFAYEEKFKDFYTLRSEDTFGYVSQLYLYAEAVGCPAGGWLVVNKSTGEMKLVQVPENDHWYRDAALKNVHKNLDTIAETCHTKGTVVERQFELQDETFRGQLTGRKVMTKSTPCYWCPFKETCWADKDLKLGPNPLSKAKNPELLWGYKEENKHDD